MSNIHDDAWRAELEQVIMHGVVAAVRTKPTDPVGFIAAFLRMAPAEQQRRLGEQPPGSWSSMAKLWQSRLTDAISRALSRTLSAHSVPSDPVRHLADALAPTNEPPDVMAIFPILRAGGPDPRPANPALKLILTSAGLMPSSASELLQAYHKLVGTIPAGRKGVLYLLDAKLKTLQWHYQGNIDPARHNGEKYVAYRREPDVPGGKPLLDANGKAIKKTQAELLGIGYAGASYSLKHIKSYSNGHLDIVAAGEAGEAVPVFLSYLGQNPTIDPATRKARRMLLCRIGQLPLTSMIAPPGPPAFAPPRLCRWIMSSCWRAATT